MSLTDNFSTMTIPFTDPVYIFCIILLSIALAPLVAAKTKLPPLVVLIIIGACLSPSVLGILERNEAVKLLEKIGLLCIMLLAGIQMNLSDLKRVGFRAIVFGCLTFGVPFVSGICLGYFLLHYSLLTSLLLGILFSPHTLISYPILMRLGISAKQSISVAIGGTVVTSIFTLCGLAIVQSLVKGEINNLLWIKLGIGLPLVAIVSFWVINQFARFILSPDFPSPGEQFIFILSTLFVVSSITLLLGIDSIVGAFIAGLSLNSVVNQNKASLTQVEFIGSNLFIPCFLLSVGLLCNPKILIQHPENLGLAALVILGAVGAKFVAAWIAGVSFQYSFPEVMSMTGLTLSRAALVLVIALYGREALLPNTSNPVLDEGLFNAIVVYILVTCLVGPLITDRYGRVLSEPIESPMPIPQ